MKYLRKLFNNKLLEYLYLFGIVIYSIKMVFKNSILLEADSYQNFLIYNSIYLLMIPKVLLQKYNKKQLISSFLIVCLALVAHHFNPTRNMLVLPLALIGIKDCDLKRVIKIVFICTMIFVVVHTTGYFVVHFNNGGSILNIPWFDRGPDRSTVLCKSYNNYGAITSMATMQYLYLTNRDSNRYLKFVLLMILSIFFYAIGTSRTSLIISVISIVFLLIENIDFIKNNIKYLKYASYFFLLLFSVSMFFMNMNSPVVKILDTLFTGRIRLSVIAYNEIGLSLFPQISKYMQNPLWLDNLVVYFVIIYGIIMTLVLALYVFYFGVYNKQDYFTDFMLIVTYFWAITERYPTYIVLTIVPLLVMYNYYENN